MARIYNVWPFFKSYPFYFGVKNSHFTKTTKARIITDSGFLNIGGTDGTRTRDPLRDRQVF
ncbi:hypothetical protein, partial [Shigella flexneri]|uniref:hypothetical protein n=1 Tax=Shigella flexneri TaxID=623 RepID=UPI000EBDB42C